MILEVINQIQWDKGNGLIPVIAQDYSTKEVLMMAFMNKEALQLSLETQIAHYYSRTKERIWKKGEQSGHTQKIISFTLDCDKDALLLQVEQIGVACHTGNTSCFFNTIKNDEIKINTNPNINPNLIYGAIDNLYHTLLERKNADPKISYTAHLYHKGENTIGKKIVEEAAELSFAIKDKSETEIIYEAADLLYHALVGLSFSNIHPDRVRQEILKRFDLGGLVEKSQRATKEPPKKLPKTNKNKKPKS